MEKSSSKKKKKQTFSLPFAVLALVFLVITLVFCNSIIKLNLLPDKYITLFTVVEGFFTFLMLIGLAFKRKTAKINIVFLIIAIIVSGIYLVVINYTSATKTFLKNAFQETTEQEEYFVIVKKNSQFNELRDLRNKEIYLFKIEDEVKEEISNKVNIDFKTVDSVKELGEGLLSNKEDAILLSSFQYNLLNEEIKDFKENIKIIYTATHNIEIVVKLNTPSTQYNVDDKVFNVCISGIDNAGSIKNVGRSDANIVATVNTKTHEILLTSIPRDYFVTLHSKKAKDKLTHSGIYGINETVTTLEDLLDIDINYYIRVNFNTVIKLVDALGGVNVHSDYNFRIDGYSFHKGTNYLNGKQALAFSRERHSFADGDGQRIKNQQFVIDGIIQKMLSSAVLTKYTSILNSLQGSFQTNIKEEEISELVKNQLNDMPKWTIEKNNLEGRGSHSSTYSMGNQQLYVTIPNEASINNAKDKINAVILK